MSPGLHSSVASGKETDTSSLSVSEGTETIDIVNVSSVLTRLVVYALAQGIIQVVACRPTYYEDPVIVITGTHVLT